MLPSTKEGSSSVTVKRLKEIDTGLGRLVLSEEAIATIAGAAAIECYGVVGMAGRKMTDGISEILGKENLSGECPSRWTEILSA